MSFLYALVFGYDYLPLLPCLVDFFLQPFEDAVRFGLVSQGIHCDLAVVDRHEFSVHFKRDRRWFLDVRVSTQHGVEIGQRFPSRLHQGGQCSARTEIRIARQVEDFNCIFFEKHRDLRLRRKEISISIV